MSRALRCGLTGTIAAAALAWAVLPGTRPETGSVMARVDIACVTVLLAVLPVLVCRRYGPVRPVGPARLIRTLGYLAVIALILAKAQVEQVTLTRLTPGAAAGVWAGAVTFLAVIGAYTLALLAVTATRPPVSPSALIIGTVAGVALGVVIYLLRLLVNYVELGKGWVGLLSGALTVATVLLVLSTAVRAGAIAARRPPQRPVRLPAAVVRARQAVAAGLCVGITSALMVTLLGIVTIVLVPHLAASVQWTLPGDLMTPGRGPTMTPGAVPAFEVAFSQAAAGYLLVLITFPVIGAGLGAWGGLIATRPGEAPGGGWGGGGHDGPDPEPEPDGGRVAWDELEEFPELAHPPEADRERVLTGVG